MIKIKMIVIQQKKETMIKKCKTNGEKNKPIKIEEDTEEEVVEVEETIVVVIKLNLMEEEEAIIDRTMEMVEKMKKEDINLSK